MDGNLEISLDKLPIKRVEFIEENGVERFPSDVDYDQKRVDLIRRIDFAWAVEEKDAKKQKSSSSKDAAATASQWQGLIENLQLAQQELSIVIDLINTVEANDAVTVAGMTRPKPLPHEALSDLSVSAATKLQCFRHLGKYFKQSAKALEQQIGREARFYGALIRLQQNWKVKRLRSATNASSSEGFLFDLSNNTLHNQIGVSWLPSISMVRVEHDSAGMLAVNIPSKSCRSFRFGFFGARHEDHPIEQSHSVKHCPEVRKKESPSDDDRIRECHSMLCKAHRAIFYEQVFALVSHEAFSPSLGAHVTGVRENYLQLNISPGISIFISVVPSGKDNHTVNEAGSENLTTAIVPFETSGEAKSSEELKKLGFPSHKIYEIYLQQLVLGQLYGIEKDNPQFSGRGQLFGQLAKDAVSPVSHFCMSLAHRIFSNKVHTELESMVIKVPYLHLASHPTWHSRTSSWTVSMMVPDSIIDGESQTWRTDGNNKKRFQKLLFQSMVMVKDDSISVEGEDAAGVVSPFKGSSEVARSSTKNKFNCDLVDLSTVLLLQAANQIVHWLHEEALMIGIKANKDFLTLSFELDHGERISLVAHVDPDDAMGCISWWLVLDDQFMGEHKLQSDNPDGKSDTRRFLGYLSLELLYSICMDLISLYNRSSNS